MDADKLEITDQVESDVDESEDEAEADKIETPYFKLKATPAEPKLEYI